MICELCDMIQKPQFMILVECLFTKLAVVATLHGSDCRIDQIKLWYFWLPVRYMVRKCFSISSSYTNVFMYGKVSYLVIWRLKSCYESKLMRFFKNWSYSYPVYVSCTFSQSNKPFESRSCENGGWSSDLFLSLFKSVWSLALCP